MKATDPQIIREITVQEGDHSVHAFTRNALTQQTKAAHRMKAASDQRASEPLCKVLADSNNSASISHVPTSSVRVATDTAISAMRAISHVREQTAISPGITTMENRTEAISHVRVATSSVAATDSSAKEASSSVAATDSSVRVATSSVAVTDNAHRAMTQMPSTA